VFRKTVTLALSVLMVIALASCSTTTPPDEVVKAFLDHVKAADYEKMAALMVKPDEAPIDVRDFTGSAPAGAEIATILEKLTYKIGKPIIDGNRAEVPVEITALDLSSMLAAVVEEYMPLALKMAFEGASEAQIQAEAERVFLEKFKGSDMKLVTNNATIPHED